MIKKILLLVAFMSIFSGAFGCTSALPLPQKEAYGQTEIYSERNDLIAVNLVTETLPGWSALTGTYILFFEGYPTLRVLPEEIKINFIPGAKSPIVKFTGYPVSYKNFRGHAKNVEIIFRDREQMAEYWLIH